MNQNDITNFNRTKHELEEFLIFSICVAGKTANTIYPRVKTLMNRLRVCKSRSPFAGVRSWVRHEIGFPFPILLRDLGIGCFKQKGMAITEVAFKGWDLRRVSLNKLESINGIGPKTARFFVLHTRNQKCAVLDRHILRFMREEHNIPTPKDTPPDGPRYNNLEQQFIGLYDEEYIKTYNTLAAFDYSIWEKYQKKAQKLHTTS